MARIPEGELERLKAEVSIERLAESQGIVLERRGCDRVGLCPFHDDHEGVPFSVEEPFGDNSRYWIAVMDGNVHTQLQKVANAFEDAGRW